MITGRSTQNSQTSICIQPHLETMKHRCINSLRNSK